MTFFLISNIFKILLIFTAFKEMNSITKDALIGIEGKINEDTIEKEVNKIVNDYNVFNERYEKLVENQNKNKNKEDYDRTKYQEEFKKLFQECEIFYEYFYKQRKRLSDFINKPTGKVPEIVIKIYNSIAEYALESKTLVEELGQKAFIDNADL